MIGHSGGSETTRPTLLIAALLMACALPALAAVGVSAVMVVSAAAGGSPPFWHGGALTLSEAAALRDQGEVSRLTASGADPNAVYALRPGVLAASALTPLEAAVGARRAEMVELLMLRGATVDDAGWRRLHCFALGTGAADVVEMLDRYKPANTPRPGSGQAAVSCEGIRTPF
jgi:hypothetical protein